MPQTDTTQLVRYAQVTYEEGLDLVEIEGFTEITEHGWVCVYGDPDLPLEYQPRTLLRTVVKIEYIPR